MAKNFRMNLYTAVVHRNCIFHCKYGFLHVLTEYQVQETGKAKRERRRREERGKREEKSGREEEVKRER